MRIARVIGSVTLNDRLVEFPIGRLLICDALDVEAALHAEEERLRDKPLDQSLVVFDELGAGVGSLVAVAEGREAAMPWHPAKRPVDAYCVAILDRVDVDERFIERA
jgi:ethanolamine utilization protein EutN